MKPFLRMIWTAVMVMLPLSACSSSGSDLPTLPSTPGSSSYRLGPGDQLDLKVLGGDELKGPYTVQDDGTISLMLIGKVPAAGLTVDELEKKIAARLAEGG